MAKCSSLWTGARSSTDEMKTLTVKSSELAPKAVKMTSDVGLSRMRLFSLAHFKRMDLVRAVSLP